MLHPGQSPVAAYLPAGLDRDRLVACTVDGAVLCRGRQLRGSHRRLALPRPALSQRQRWRDPDRKSTRLNSSHSQISYAVFCLKKKKKKEKTTDTVNEH